MATTNHGRMRVNLLEHGGNEEILEEARVEPIAMVMRRLEWFGQVKEETAQKTSEQLLR